MSDDYFIRPLDFAQGRADKPFKHTFLATPRLLVGLNSLQPGQRQALHDHPDQDKFYLVLAGRGRFTVGECSRECGPGELVLAPASVIHGVENQASELLTFLTVIAPWSETH
ncbi:MAG TPA: cupin domain-containing protein [Caldilineaceae bacterium]|nr:cupin domain-containing protein [Caldilineaceae bacterium]